MTLCKHLWKEKRAIGRKKRKKFCLVLENHDLEPLGLKMISFAGLSKLEATIL